MAGDAEALSKLLDADDETDPVVTELTKLDADAQRKLLEELLDTIDDSLLSKVEGDLEQLIDVAKHEEMMQQPAEPERQEHGSATTAPDETMRQAPYIPMRITEAERQLLTILEASLFTSEYTDRVDIYRGGRNRVSQELKGFVHILCGLLVAHAVDKKSLALVEKPLDENLPLFAKCCEIGRRAKISNPKQMRSTYGKLMCIMMDAGTDLECPILTLKRFLATKQRGLDLLADPLLRSATSPGPERAAAVASLVSKYASPEAPKEPASVSALMQSWVAEEAAIAAFEQENARGTYQTSLSAADVKRVVNSVVDYYEQKENNVQVIDRMLALLEEIKADPKVSLQIRTGSQGSCLSHTHEMQALFVQQSLQLWRKLMSNFAMLWVFADHDLCNQPYRLMDTGQGLNRMQSAPTTSKAMHTFLAQTKSECTDRWVGLSVAHFGDRDVPNALTFIDKYSQVPRILGPIVRVIEKLDEYRFFAPPARALIESLGGPAIWKRAILTDFFRHGFDGSGDDGGSCLDGRLTSCWNWCSKLEKKEYFAVFQLAEHYGFDI